METRAGSNWRRASQMSSVMSGPCASPQSGRWTVAPGVSLGKRLSPPNVAPAGAEDADAITTQAEPIIGSLHDAIHKRRRFCITLQTTFEDSLPSKQLGQMRYCKCSRIIADRQRTN